MKTVIALILLLHGAAAVTHSLKYFYTASSGIPNFPGFVAVGQFDGVETMRYDSNTRRAVAKQDWLDKIIAEDPQYLERDTQNLRGSQQTFKVSIDILKQRLNQTGGVHMFQMMVGCEWDDQTPETDGFWQFAYDGEDFIAFDLKTLTWTAPKPQAVPTKLKWDNDKAWIESTKQYLKQLCVDWLKKYVDYGKSSLLRTERPSVSFLRRTATSPVSCFATGFYPDRAMIFWKKDGEELNDGVDIGEVLPNHDGTFQVSADLTLPEGAKDLHKYECVFQLSGVEDLFYKLDAHPIKTNEWNPMDTTNIIIIVAVIVLAAVLAASIGVMLYKKKKNANCPQPGSDSDSELSQREKLNTETER